MSELFDYFILRKIFCQKCARFIFLSLMFSLFIKKKNYVWRFHLKHQKAENDTCNLSPESRTRAIEKQWVKSRLKWG